MADNRALLTARLLQREDEVVPLKTGGLAALMGMPSPFNDPNQDARYNAFAAGDADALMAATPDAMKGVPGGFAIFGQTGKVAAKAADAALKPALVKALQTRYPKAGKWQWIPQLQVATKL